VSFVKGNLSYTRFFVEKKLDLMQLDALASAISLRRFRPLKAQGTDLQSIGWADWQNPYDDEAELHFKNYVVDKNILLSFREDTIALPKALIQEKLRQQLQVLIKQGEKPNPKKRYALEMNIREELRQKALPKSACANIIWNFQENHLRFFSRGTTIIEKFCKLFEQTFDCKPVLLNFGYKAIQLAPLPDEQLRLNALKPQLLFQAIERLEI